MNGNVEAVHFAPSKSHRFHLLDALRGIAAFLVVLWHHPADLRPWFSYPNGFLAVDFFFCLSGLVIAFSYEDRLRRGLGLKDFFVARMIRLYPLYFLGTVTGLGAAVLISHAMSQPGLHSGGLSLVVVLNLCLLPNLIVPWKPGFCFPLDGPAWSLFFEIVANLVYAILLRLRLATNMLLAAIVVVSFIIISTVKIFGVDAGPLQDTFVLGLPRVGLSFFAGVLIYRLYKRSAQPHLAGRFASFSPLAVVFGLLFTLMASGRVFDSRAFQLFAVAALFPMIVYVGARSALSPRWTPLCAFLGDFSYALYILHVPFLSPLGGRVVTRLVSAHPFLVWIIAPSVLAMLVALSYSAGLWIDTPVRRKLSRRYNAYVAGSSKRLSTV